MSQNFELLSQLEAELSLRVTPRTIPQAEKAVEETKPADLNQSLLNMAQTVFLSGNGNAPHHVVLCGVDNESSSSRICIELGRILACYSSQPVCLVDADTRSSRLSRLHTESRGTAIAHGAHEQLKQIEKNLWLASLDTLDITQRNPLAQENQLKERIEKLKQSFQFILIDAPAINSRSDAAILGQIVDGAILIIEANATRKVAALKAKEAMEVMNVRLLGCVLNNRTFPLPEKLYRRL